MQDKKKQEKQRIKEKSSSNNKKNNNDYENNLYIYASKQDFSVFVKILYFWYYRSKQIIFLKNLVK